MWGSKNSLRSENVSQCIEIPGFLPGFSKKEILPNKTVLYLTETILKPSETSKKVIFFVKKLDCKVIK